MADDSHHWRDSARRAKFFMIDAISALPLFAVFVHISWATFFMSLAVSVFFAILERFNFTLPMFVRWFKSVLAGPRRIAYPWWRR
jgi:intracellular multiplication protein IcmT